MQYHDFLRTAKSHISKTLSEYGTNFGNNTVFGQLINVLSDTVQNIMLYIEDALTEQNKYTAQRKKSIWNLAQMSGYDPSFGKTAKAEIELSYIPNNVGNLDLIIHNREQLTCTQNGLPYCIVLPQESIVMSIAKDNTSKTFGIVEGRFETQSFTLSGGKLYSQSFAFAGNIDLDYMDVAINGETWTKIDSFYDMDADAKQYTVKPGIDGRVVILFGNNVHGRSVKNGDVMTVTYLIHDGEEGNIDINKGCDFAFNNPLYTIDGESVSGDAVFLVRVTSKDSISSGTNSETTEEIRPMIGLNSRSFVLADPNNYKNFINKFSFCGYNRTWSENGSLAVNSLIMKNYKNQMSDGKDYFSLSEQDFVLSDNQKTSVLNCIRNTGSQLAGVSYNIFDPELCKYAATIYITLKNNSYNTTYISNQIRNLVGDFFSNLENDMFVPKSDIVNLIKNNISEIDSVDVYFLSERNENAIIHGKYENTTYKYNPASGTYTKQSETVYLYDGENPNLGFDEHGNILIESNSQYPVLMGGWKYKSSTSNEDIYSDQLITVDDPLIIIFK